MKLTLLGAAVLTASFCWSDAAVAAVEHDFGPVAGVEDFALSDTFAGNQTFLYHFELTSPGRVFGSWSSLPVAYDTGTFAFANNAVSGGFALLGGGYTGLQYYSSTGIGADGFSFNVGPGVYTLKFSADSDPYRQVAEFSTYAQVSAVPEPAVSAILLAGLVATGFLARRRWGG